MVLQTLVLAAAVLATGPAADTDKPKGEAAKGWIVELNGYIYHRDAAPKAEWIIEIQGYTYHRDAAPKAKLIIESVEAQYYDDVRPFFEQLKKQKP